MGTQRVRTGHESRTGGYQNLKRERSKLQHDITKHDAGISKLGRMNKLATTFHAWEIITQFLTKNKPNITIAKTPVINIGIKNGAMRKRIQEYHDHLLTPNESNTKQNAISFET